MPTSKLSVSALCVTVLVTLSLSATTPAHAISGGWMSHQTTKFMMKNGSRFNMNTREEAWAGKHKPIWNEAARTKHQLASVDQEDGQAENPGWFIELISICDHLKNVEITCEY